MQHFENPKSVEIISNKYCCCDLSKTVDCTSNLAGLDLKKCTEKCDPYFVVHFRECPYNATCFVTKLFELEDYYNPYPLSQYGLFIEFGESKLSNAVRIKDITC